jgi:FixJ family two-component response regulator
MSTALPLIAVLDDDAFVCKALQRLLRSAGLNVETYSSGGAFLRSLASHAPDCLVLDVHMPNLNGFEVQSRLAQAGLRVPVVIITGHDTPESRARALAGHAAAYLLKPIDERTLLDAIAGAIAKAGT